MEMTKIYLKGFANGKVYFSAGTRIQTFVKKGKVNGGELRVNILKKTLFGGGSFLYYNLHFIQPPGKVIDLIKSFLPLVRLPNVHTIKIWCTEII